MQKPSRRLLTLALLILAGCNTTSRKLICDSSRIARAPRNFGVVLTAAGSAAPVFRGGQPESCDELDYLRAIGVRSILKLNDRNLPLDADETQQAARLGLRMVSFPFRADTIGDPETCADVRAALAFLADPQNQPVYVHCTAGKDRTGYLVGLYEKLILGKAAADVLAELHEYGHNGMRSAAFAQIDRELAREVPACAPPKNP